MIAADQQATHGALGVQTVGQPTLKIELVGTEALFAASGRVGLAQQLASVIERRKGEFARKTYDNLIRDIQTDFRALINPAFDTATKAAPVIGHPAVQGDVICHSLLAAPFRDGVRLVEISPVVAVEVVNESLPFIALGSGKGSADPFLGFLRKVYWGDRPPSLVEGSLAAYWTIKHAIDMKVAGVGFDVDVCVLEKVDDKFRARQLAKEELLEHQSFIAEAEAAMRAVRTKMTAPPGEGAEPVSEPPRP